MRCVYTDEVKIRLRRLRNMIKYKYLTTAPPPSLSRVDVYVLCWHFLIEIAIVGRSSYLNLALRRRSQVNSSAPWRRTTLVAAPRYIRRNCYCTTAHIVALFGHCDWNLNFIHRLVYIRPVTYSNRTVCVRASCPYVPSHHNTAAMLPIILISIAIIRPDWIRKVQTPSILQRDVFRAVKSNALESRSHWEFADRLDFLRQLNNVTKCVTMTNIVIFRRPKIRRIYNGD